MDDNSAMPAIKAAAPPPNTRNRPRLRDAEATQKRILKAAKKEFAQKGLAGARVDVIAEKADANKRMIYHYFGSKAGLFQRVLEDAYLGIRNAEKKLALDRLPAIEALEKLVRFTWQYYLANPEFITLINSENLHRAKHLKNAASVQVANRQFVEMTRALLARGVEEGSFRQGIDAVQLNITIAALGYYYLTNRHTGHIVFERDMMSKAALDERLAFNIETVMRLVCRENK